MHMHVCLSIPAPRASSLKCLTATSPEARSVSVTSARWPGPLKHSRRWSRESIVMEAKGSGTLLPLLRSRCHTIASPARAKGGGLLWPACACRGWWAALVGGTQGAGKGRGGGFGGSCVQARKVGWCACSCACAVECMCGRVHVRLCACATVCMCGHVFVSVPAQPVATTCLHMCTLFEAMCKWGMSRRGAAWLAARGGQGAPCRPM